MQNFGAPFLFAAPESAVKRMREKNGKLLKRPSVLRRHLQKGGQGDRYGMTVHIQKIGRSGKEGEGIQNPLPVALPDSAEVISSAVPEGGEKHLPPAVQGQGIRMLEVP